MASPTGMSAQPMTMPARSNNAATFPRSVWAHGFTSTTIRGLISSVQAPLERVPPPNWWRVSLERIALRRPRVRSHTRHSIGAVSSMPRREACTNTIWAQPWASGALRKPQGSTTELIQQGQTVAHGRAVLPLLTQWAQLGLGASEGAHIVRPRELPTTT